MREALLKIPTHDNNGASLDALKNETIMRACDLFGGASVSKSEGAWKDPKTGKLYLEPVFDVVIAMDQTNAWAKRQLLGLAKQVKLKGEQLTVYVRDANGEVHFV